MAAHVRSCSVFLTRRFLAGAGLLAALLSGCVPGGAGEGDLAQARSKRQSVVYGQDGRVEVYQIPSTIFAERARGASLVMVPLDAVTGVDPVTFAAPTLGEFYELCDDEAFVDQPTAANCSATLIDSRRVLTAGHCAPDLATCQQSLFTFDYLLNGPGDPEVITQEDLYFCARIVTQQYEPDGIDFAIVELDRDVAGRTPAPVSTTFTPVAPDAPLVMLGAPSGIYVKYEDTGHVIDPRADTLDYFVAAIDAFSGNSGSGVYDPSGQVIGILVRGEQDYVFDPGAGCARVNVLPEQSGNEDVVYAANAIRAMCDLGEPSPLCDSLSPLCQTCVIDDECTEGALCRAGVGGNDVRYCSPPCANGDQCAPGHLCTVEGVCVPDAAPSCVGGDVYYVDACGNTLTLVEECGNAPCIGGTCGGGGTGETCAGPLVLPAVSQVIDGIITGADPGALDPTCVATTGDERVYTFNVEEPTNFSASVVGGPDTVMYLRHQSCGLASAEVACDDDSGPSPFGSFFEMSLEPGVYFLIVDTFGQGDTGNFTLEVTFSQGGCFDTCVPGEARCGPEQTVEVCSVDQQGCFVWFPEEQCPQGSPCIDGECVADCIDSCPVQGATQCAGEHAFVTCTAFDVDDDPCLEWNLGAPCAEGSVCQEGACVEVCAHACDIGEARCVDETTLSLCASGPDGCRDFLTTVACTDDCTEIQGQGTCTPACEVGENECAFLGERRCTDEGAPEACVLGEDGCLGWSAGAPCAGETVCQDGICTGAQCEDSCTPGDSRCTDEGRVQTCIVGRCAHWSAPMTCPAGGVCEQGLCTGSCESRCDIGAQQCSGKFSRSVCVDVGACAVWAGPSYCFGNEVCEGGACVPMPSAADGGEPVDGGETPPLEPPVVVRVKGVQSCTQTGASPEGWGLAVWGAMRLLWRRRRRA